MHLLSEVLISLTKKNNKNTEQCRPLAEEIDRSGSKTDLLYYTLLHLQEE